MSWFTKSFDRDVVLNYQDNGRLVRKWVSRAQFAALTNAAKVKATIHDHCAPPAIERADEQAYREATRALFKLGMM